MNLSDPDSKLVHGTRGWVQGYNAQVVTNERHLFLAAEVMTASPDFGHLEPMFSAAQAELAAAGVNETPKSWSPTPATGTWSRSTASRDKVSRY